MDEVRILEIKQSVFANNDQRAELLRRELKEKRIFLLNLMSSPGSGKTTTLTRTIERLRDEFKIGVMEADIDSDVDARTIAATGVKSIQLHTGGMCHLDADMTRQGLDGLAAGDVELAVLENVGNLVCPAEFDTGAVKNAAILSVPEGDDKPLKYPLMFQICDVVLINKTDVLPYFDFDMEKCRENIRMRNPNAKVIPICANVEADIAAMDPEDRALFLADLGVEQSGLDRLIQASYTLLGLISYLTCGEDECRAWTITRGTKAPKAAGKIHTDFERGFIRAEVVSFADLEACGGSMTAAKEKGLVRSEGKEYVMQDGDVVLFRFNV